MSDSIFMQVFDKYFKDECPPTQGSKEKSIGCFQAHNDYGKEPNKYNCMACWKECFDDIFWEENGISKEGIK